MNQIEKIIKGIKFATKLTIADLKEQGVDFTNPNYVWSPLFIKLQNKFIDHSLGLTEAWSVENTAVPQTVINSIYGPFSMCASGFKEESYSKESLLNYIADSNRLEVYKDFFKDIPEGYDSELYFFRNNGNKLGVKQKLKKWGIDVSIFDDRESEFKLYFLIFLVEHHPVLLKKYNPNIVGSNKYLNIFKFLNNPTTENADRTAIGIRAANIEIIQYLKSETIKGISLTYAFNVQKAFELITRNWNDFLVGIRSGIESYDDNKEILHNALEKLLQFCRDYNFPNNNHDSLLETFYLKLREHEHIGIERDISLGVAFLKKLPAEFNYSIVNHSKTSNKIIKFDEVRSLLEERRKIYASIVFSSDDVTSNDYVKFDKASEVVLEFLAIRRMNEAYRINSITELDILVIIDEFIKLSKTEKIDNSFFRHKVSEPRNLRADVTKANTAFGINQIAWLKYINYRVRKYYYQVDNDFDISIDLAISKILTLIYSANCMDDLRKTHSEFFRQAQALFKI